MAGGLRGEKGEWRAYKQARFDAPPLHRSGLAAPGAGPAGSDQGGRRFRASRIDAAKFFDAGDVQANGFQIVEDDRTGDTYTEAGASYMGFAVSALLASALSRTSRAMASPSPATAPS